MLLVFTVANTMTYPTELRVFCLRFMMWLRDQSPDVLDKQLLDVDADNRCLVEDLLIKYMVIGGAGVQVPCWCVHFTNVSASAG